MTKKIKDKYKNVSAYSFTTFNNELVISFDGFEEQKDILEFADFVFAKIKIFKNDFIGYGLKDKKRSLLGRYTNHSSLNNSKFIPEDKSDIILIATKDIEINEEILVNYRHHTKLPDGHKRNKGTNN